MRFSAALLTAALLVPVIATAADEKDDANLPKHQLPEDPKAAVITLDFVGGFGPPRKNNDPSLLIRADGTAVVGDPWGTQKRIEFKLKPGDVQELLRFAIDSNKFFELDSAKLAKAVEDAKKQGGIGFAVADAATTLVKINADGKQHEVKYYALGMIARQYPKIEGLQQLYRVERRLYQVRSQINAGGPEGVAKLLKLVNAALKEESPDTEPLTAEDLQSANHNPRRGLNVSFMRRVTADGKRTTTSARVSLREDDEPSVSVDVDVDDVKAP